MTLRISGKNLETGAAFRTHIEERINAVLEKYGARLISGHVTVEPEGPGFRADCILHLSSGVTLRADATAQEPYASFNRVADFIESQVRRHRERLLNHHHSSASVNGSGFAGRLVHDEAKGIDIRDQGDSYPTVIAEPVSSIRQMTVSEAAIELESNGCPAIVFQHASDRRLGVVYRRADGNIGWVDFKDAEKTPN